MFKEIKKYIYNLKYLNLVYFSFILIISKNPWDKIQQVLHFYASEVSGKNDESPSVFI